MIQFRYIMTPWLAKLIVHDDNRALAIRKLKKAINDYQIDGIASTLDFGSFVLDHPEFISGDYEYAFCQELLDCGCFISDRRRRHRGKYGCA